MAEVIQPYYQDESVTIYNADCRDVLPTLDKVDLIICDPPFNIWKTITLKLPEAKSIIAFTNPQNREYTDAILGKPKTELVWYFEDGRWVSHSLPRITHEYIYLYGQCGDAFVGSANPQHGQRIDKGKGSVGRDVYPERTYIPRSHKQLNSVLTYPKNVSSDLGVWSKPLPMMKTLMQWVGGQTILDPFMGSGTTLRAAKDLNRKAIGIEIEERYCEIAAKRMSQLVMELK